MEKGSFSWDDLKLKFPFGLYAAGASQSGKTTLCEKFIATSQLMFDPAPQSVLYSYGQANPKVFDLERYGVEIHDGLPDLEELNTLDKPALVILDDMLDIATEKYLKELYTKKVHHNNLGVFTLNQDVFDKACRIARLNSQYLLLTRAPSMEHQVKMLGTQMFPGQHAFFMDTFHKCTARPFGYLFIDNHPRSDKLLQLRTNIFPGEDHIVFRPRKV